ncbi:SMP-30/Gluconolaconase/LRE-like region-containing protein [Nocardioides alpinus]|uniref:SMP-30/Gluconolaconase/LRE-like region-containing protein n=1 Tax=Nocardioides alpinus TaxID=748909 RepID=A0A1I1AZL6_9ACTN|nr:SMP-30/gluconolactonase/LRE family protein [Nocardioides alpinus]PKH41433.1 SMP-30/gluconolactonase/LRE family protein [Nocardioides alpinus]SFB43545.1 SMP-30/Gluconolaconase/LRE-like region-containing protein [Nocardioides alpinus]
MTFTVHPVPSMGAEDVVVSAEGVVYTGTEDGAIWAVDAGTGSARRVADTGGRPLGLEMLPSGHLLVCDAQRGLLQVHQARGTVEVLVDRVEGQEMRFCNNAAVGADGTIWFSDSSLHFGIAQWKDDFVQHTRTGRLLRRDPDGTVTVVLTGLAFANGVALSADESYVAVAECRGRTVVRLWLAGPRAGQRDHLVTDLPGYPDNISRGSDGLVWVAVASPVDPLVERLGSAPMVLRKAVTRIPEALQPRPKHTIRVQAYDDAGRLVHDLDIDHPGYHMVTGVREHDGKVWMGSLHEPSVAVYDLA